MERILEGDLDAFQRSRKDPATRTATGVCCTMVLPLLGLLFGLSSLATHTLNPNAVSSEMRSVGLDDNSRAVNVTCRVPSGCFVCVRVRAGPSARARRTRAIKQSRARHPRRARRPPTPHPPARTAAPKVDTIH